MERKKEGDGLSAAAKHRPAGAREIAYIALMAAVIAVCAFISVPAVVPFTMQTFGVFCAVGLLGGRMGSICVGVYILLGAVGLPVFAGFSGGIGRLIGATGGYIAGFLMTALVYWLVTWALGDGLWQMVAGMALGLLACYLFGTVWYVAVYAAQSGPVSFAAALLKCVIPFVIPDIIKLCAAVMVVRRLKRKICIVK